MEKFEEASNLAKRAVQFDKDSCTDAAVYFYSEAAKLIDKLCVELTDGPVKEEWLKKSSQYKERARQLLLPVPVDPIIKTNPALVKLGKCKFLFTHALDADEAGQRDEAIRMYTEAIQMCLEAKKETEDSNLQDTLKSIAIKALERAEELKGNNLSQRTPVQEPAATSRVSSRHQASFAKPSLVRGSSAHLKVSGTTTYTEEEKRVLLATSYINNREYVPFMDIDLTEKFQYAIPFTDKDGPLALSPKQLKHFSRWARPEEICSDPKLIQGTHVDYQSIKQTVVSDCSFVASLAVSALYEKKFNKRLITSIIYPKNREKRPILNPFGKYMVKLHLNGVPRKIIVDDTLPVGRHGELLCSFSTNKNEMWISILEKAYMKVMGGYDFPGSNSNIDLHALTGWIPERIAIRPNDPDFNAGAVFNTLFERLHRGDVLATVATGELDDNTAERAGLVPTHAYALLDARLVDNVQLLQLKNPWSHVRWRGNYSELDTIHWTPRLMKALNYDPNSAAMFDNGIFWIDYKSLLRFFDVIYLNWNPSLFNYTYCIHKSWAAGCGPIKDSYNIGDNPQFKLSVDEDAKGAIWILLTRHITELEDFKNNSEYITILVYKNNGKRVYYPYDPPPYLNGVRINSPHYLTKIILDKAGSKKFTLVVSQFAKTVTINYTLRAYATCPFLLEPLPNKYPFSVQEHGEWKGRSAGGCSNHPSTYIYNPCYKFTLSMDSAMTVIDLKAPKERNVGFEITSADVVGFAPRSTGPYRSGFVVLELEDLPAGSYYVVPSTFLPNQESQFILTFKSVCKIQVTRTN